MSRSYDQAIADVPVMSPFAPARLIALRLLPPDLLSRAFVVLFHGGVAVRDTLVANGPRHWGQNRSAACCALRLPAGTSQITSGAATILDTIPFMIITRRSPRG